MRRAWLLTLLAVLVAHVAARPYVLVRRFSMPGTVLQRVLASEKAPALFRIRKSIPDGYFTEFAVDDEHMDRQRRGQPIADYTDEFSADPFEIPRHPMRKPR
ncbi:unnamed protein product [Caenorhabditis auriculariae]|uniref:Uncharacterized protein n=1 Tax=Caenorhabditis auriculariae TaxID=2777116 RepID=A0A8S1H960_9PELO|nr:unnamed protein product [Caenorhabditis auriculariae]